jgi:hypothetical protein
MIIVLLLVLIIVFVVVPSFLVLQENSITGKAITDYSGEKTHKFTKTFCNKNNICQEFKVTCFKNRAIEIKPLSNNTQFGKNQDFFSDEMIRKLCEN